MNIMTASTLALTIAATGALAQSADDTGTRRAADLMGMQGDLIRSRDITGGEIYTTNTADDEGWNGATTYDTIGAGWNQIGEIEDVVLSRDGQMVGIVAEVGGFLDIGDKHVVIPLEDVNLVATDDRSYAYVTRMNEEDLEAMQGVDEGFWD